MFRSLSRIQKPHPHVTSVQNASKATALVFGGAYIVGKLCFTDETVQGTAFQIFSRLTFGLGISALNAHFCREDEVEAACMGFFFPVAGTLLGAPIKVLSDFLETNNFTLTASFFEWMSAFGYSILTVRYLISLSHELGHYSAYSILTPKISHGITLSMLSGAHISKIAEAKRTDYSKIGIRLGRDKCRTISSMCGPLFEMLSSAALLAGASYLENSSPFFRKVCITASLISFVDNYRYAASGDSSKAERGNDYAVMKKGGIPTIVGKVACVALPLFILLCRAPFRNC